MLVGHDTSSKAPTVTVQASGASSGGGSSGSNSNSNGASGTAFCWQCGHPILRQVDTASLLSDDAQATRSTGGRCSPPVYPDFLGA